MKPPLPNRVLAAGLIALAAFTARTAEEKDLVAILRSAAGVPEKCAACQQLRIYGTAQSVPALAAFLTEERVGHAARYTLEGMPFPEADSALRAAVGRSHGLIRAGLIDSLGWRRDAASVPLLTPLLSASDTTVAAATASALGRIGNQDAVAALLRAREDPIPSVRTAVLDALLSCAEERRTADDDSGAATLYRDLINSNVPPETRAAAWRGLALADEDRRPALIAKALGGTDEPVRLAALKLVRELNDAKVVKACLQRWDFLPSEARLALIDAHVRFGAEALPTVRRASGSPDLALRVAAWRALTDLSDSSMIPALARAAANGEPAERDAARDTLARIRGPGVREALLAHLDKADPAEQAEILRALGERGDEATTPVLLRYASTADDPVRRAALESLGRLAVADTLPSLLDLAVAAKSEADRAAVLKALYAVCEASSDKARTSRQVVAALDRFTAPERRHLLPLLAELGTPDALVAAWKATRDEDPELVRESIRVLTQWPNAAAVPYLFELAADAADRSVRILALRGGIAVAGRESDPSARLALLRKALSLADRPEEKRLALGQLGGIAQPEAAELAWPYLADPALANEAGSAVIGIAEALVETNPELAEEMAAKVLAHSRAPVIVKRAWVLRTEAPAGGPFIRDWLVCGPYRQAGAVGATAVFNLVLGPEKPGETVPWQAVPVGDTVSLAAIFPGQANCVAYLKTEIVAPEATDAILLMGSDDGIEAWLNGKVVHSNNIDRGMVVDQDMAPIKLNRGANELLLKITQGGGGWSACARVVGRDGLPIEGLRVRPPTGG